MVYQPRTYRDWVSSRGLVSFSVMEKETDLLILAQRDLTEVALAAARKCRAELEGYISKHRRFLSALEPLPVAEDAPLLVRQMASAAEAAGVGPMAAVAGAIAEYVGKELLRYSDEVIVENGGDIFLKIAERRRVGLYAGTSPFTGKMGFDILPEETPLGVCTSSGTVGHSLSFGRADAVITFSPSTSLADAAATAIANIVQTADDIPIALRKAEQIPGLKGVVVIKDDAMGLWGQVRLVQTGDE